MSAVKKDKQKVLGEVFDDARIKSFFEYQAPAGVNADFHLLEKAYRGMLAESFGTFLTFFLEGGHDINAQNPDGKTILSIAREHRCGEEYVELLTAKGAQ